MAVKQFVIADDLTVSVYKRRLSRGIRLSIAANGDVRVSIPTWLTFRAGEAFAKGKLEWIRAQRQIPTLLLPGQVIGRHHRLLFKVSIGNDKVSTRINNQDIVITAPLNLTYDDPAVQAAARRAAIRALRQEAEQLLPGRLRDLAAEHGFKFKSVTIKQLTSRWGSCDSKQQIALNLFLMQLPWHLVDYVLLHELVHTQHLHHGDDFWSALERVCPGAKKLRTEIRKHKPVVVS